MKHVMLGLIILSIVSCKNNSVAPKEEVSQDSILVVTDAAKDSNSSHIPDSVK